MSPPLVVAAIRQEVAPFLRSLSGTTVHDGVIRGTRGGRGVSLILTGMGGERALRTLRPLLGRGGWSCLISTGFAGALSPDLSCGDLVLGRRLFMEQGGRIVPLPLPPPLTVGAFCPVSVVTVDEPLPKGEVASRLPADAGVSVVDMESAFVGELAASHGIPLILLRVILDPLTRSIPFTLHDVMGEGGHPSIGKTLLFMLRHPPRIPAILSLARQSGIAARSLSRGLDDLLGRVGGGS